jgi:hypothetical protein
MLKGVKIVDCDTHVTEAPDMFTKRAPAKFKGKVPEVRRVDGVDRWFVGDRNFGSLGGNVIRADNNKLLGRLAFPTIGEGHIGAWDNKARVQSMDDMGVYAQICFQNSGVTQAGSLGNWIVRCRLDRHPKLKIGLIESGMGWCPSRSRRSSISSTKCWPARSRS